jgi:hypothetical protein
MSCEEMRMIDPLKEETLNLGRACRRLPSLRRDRPVAPSTLWRWATNGVRGIRLETVQIGATTCTSVEALRRFFAALNNQTNQVPTSNDRHERAEKQLAERGI